MAMGPDRVRGPTDADVGHATMGRPSDRLGGILMHRTHRSLLTRLRRAARADAGSATLESTGMWALAALVAVAVAVALLSNTPALGDTVRRAICLVTTLGQGACTPVHTSAAEHRPPEPCVVSSDGHDSSAEVSFVVTLKTGEQWQVDQLSDGTYRVTRGASVGVGAGVGVGFNVTATVNGNDYGAALAAGAGGEATFAGGEVYTARNQDEVNALLEAHSQDLAEDLVVGGSGPARWLVDKAESAVGIDHSLPEPDARFIEGGISLSADAQATLVTASADAGAGVTEVLGYQTKHDGSTTEYFKGTLDAHGQASVLGGEEHGPGYQLAMAKAEGQVAATIQIDRGADGKVSAVRLTSLLVGEALARSNTLTNADPQASGYVERTVELPVGTEGDRVIAQNFLSAMGMPEVAGINLPPSAVSMGSIVDLGSSTLAFAQAARDRGHISEQTFDHETNTNGGTFDAEAIAKVGGSVQYNSNNRSATGGQYWDGTQMVTWTGCGG